MLNIKNYQIFYLNKISQINICTVEELLNNLLEFQL